MTKTEKLKEINEMINEICVDLETKLFIEDTNFEENRIIKKYDPDINETKQ